jgi:hypothetical protein
MLTHINHDLPLALVAAYQKHGTSPTSKAIRTGPALGAAAPGSPASLCRHSGGPYVISSECSSRLRCVNLDSQRIKCPWPTLLAQSDGGAGADALGVVRGVPEVLEVAPEGAGVALAAR